VSSSINCAISMADRRASPTLKEGSRHFVTLLHSQAMALSLFQLMVAVDGHVEAGMLPETTP
jgi:hypothetical protein